MNLFNQRNLFGGSYKVRESPEICCEPCFMAREKRCVCGCGGEYHGKGRHEINPEYEFYLDEKIADKFRDQMDPKRSNCLCGYPLGSEPLVYYKPHESGWKIPGESEPVWLYVKCPKCGYDMAIWKMGVPRKYEP